MQAILCLLVLCFNGDDALRRFSLGARAGVSLHKILVHSRHAIISTLQTYLDHHDQTVTQTSLANLVAGALIES
jgi:hypothetical protein